MKLRPKTALMVAGTFAILVAALYVILSRTFIRSFDELEQTQATDAVGRLQKAVRENLGAMLVQLTDWSNWNDVYAYIQGKMPEFEEPNFTQELLKNSNLAFMIFIDSNGKIIRVHHPNERPVPDSFIKLLVPGSRFLPHETAGPPSSWTEGSPKVGGFYDLGQDGAYLVGAQAITDGAGQLPTKGSLIFGRHIDEEFLTHFSEVMLAKVTCQFLSSPTLGDEFRAAIEALPDESTRHIELIDDRRMAGYCRFNDFDGKATAIFRMEMPRDVYQRGQATKRVFLMSLAAAGAVSLAVTLLLLDANVISRLRRLSQQALAIGSSRDFSGRVDTRGTDELADLGGSVNQMLGALQAAEGSVRAAGAEMERILNSVTDGLFLLDS
ncbi:MAG TPA: CHASE4 domain-containing protein, partial [candidate division Zixibacteria bacterium]|nr:CHASE4 domain-containing protein [candidate division Zixibacteria bacterium]